MFCAPRVFTKTAQQKIGPIAAGDAERQEIDRTGCTALEPRRDSPLLMMVYGIMAAPEATPRMKQSEPSREECRCVNQLHEADQHDHRTAEIDGLAAYRAGLQAQPRKAGRPNTHPSGHHRNGEDGIRKGKQFVGLEKSARPRPCPPTVVGTKQQPGGKAAKVGLRIRKDDFVRGQESTTSLFHAVCWVFPLA